MSHSGRSSRTVLTATRLDVSAIGSLQQWSYDDDVVIVVGRSPQSDILLAVDRISRVHAAIFFDGVEWICSCVGRNGMLVGGRSVLHITVREGVEVEFGPGGPRLLLESVPIDGGASAAEAGDVTILLDQLQNGDDAAAGALWNNYFPRVVALARKRLGHAPRRVSDEEDVALSVLESLYRGVNEGRFPDLNNRDNLWRLLVVMTARKVVNVIEKNTAQKRGGGAVRGESVLQGPEGAVTVGFDRFAGDDQRPDFVMLLAEESERRLLALDDDLLRRIAVLKLQGSSNEEIARELNVSLRTLERRLQQIRQIWSEQSVDE